MNRAEYVAFAGRYYQALQAEPVGPKVPESTRQVLNTELAG